MRLRLTELLACPIDRQPLELRAWEDDALPLNAKQREVAACLRISPTSIERDVRTGLLVNPRLKILYPILGGVPRLLTFRVAVHRHFLRQFGDRMRREFASYSFPETEPTPGEREVLRSFSSEWVNYDWKEDAYWDRPAEDWYRVMDYMLDLKHHPISGKRVLEVGIGIGGMANHIAAAHECEMAGVDLSYAVDPAQRYFGRQNPFFHVIQASAFKLPFSEDSFDLVYSHGVLHHTYSTQRAVEAISRFPKKGGGGGGASVRLGL